MPRQKGKTVSLLEGESGWKLQTDLWGYAILGEMTEPDACASERPDDPNWRRWDRTLADLASDWIDRGRGWEQAPYWYCLVHLPWSWRERAYADHSDGTLRSNETGGSVEA